MIEGEKRFFFTESDDESSSEVRSVLRKHILFRKDWTNKERNELAQKVWSFLNDSLRLDLCVWNTTLKFWLESEKDQSMYRS